MKSPLPSDRQPSVDGRFSDAAGRFRRALESGKQPEIEDYIVAVPARERAALVRALIRVEIDVRLGRGEAVSHEDYRSRFADHSEIVEEVFADSREPTGPSTGRDAPQRERLTVDELRTGAYVPTDDPDAPAPGGTLGRFELKELLGQGAFGSVFRARDPQLDRDVALKVPRAGVLSTADDVQRFLREARAAAQLHHPNIVPIHEAGRIGSYHYIAADLVDGSTLRRWMTERGPLPAAEACRLVRQLALALQHAHAGGIVHRDIKPENILLDRAGAPLLADFGLAHRDEGDQLKTQEGLRMGTPAYMSPEQARGHSHLADARSDLWSLGVVLYELLTGRRPFTGNMAEVIRQITESDPESPRALVRGIPRDVATICLKCLRKEADRRYATCGELADDLERFLADQPVQARKTPVWERAWKWRRRRPAAATALATGVALLLAGLAGGVWYWDARLRVKIEHYVYFAKRFGIPEGVERLTPEQAARKEFSIRLHRQGGAIVRMEVVNGRGFYSDRYTADAVIAEEKDRTRLSKTRKAVRFDYRRDEGGKLTDEVAHDMAGKVLWTLHYATPTVGHYKDRKGFPDPRVGSGAAYVEFVWSPEGYPAEKRFLDRDGKPKPVVDGVYAVRTAHDVHGLPLREEYLGPDGQLTLNAEGFAAANYSRDARGAFIHEKAFFGTDGRPIHNELGYAAIRQEFDPAGNFSRVTFHGTDGAPTVNGEGEAGYSNDYDATGCRTRSFCLGTDGRLATSGFGCCERHIVCDTRGYETGVSYFDTAGNPCLVKSGNHSYRHRIDDSGDIVLTEYFGFAGEPTINRDIQVARIEARYDEWGNQIEASYFGVDGRPINHKVGMARYTNKYDDRGRTIEFAYYGTDGKPGAIDDRYAISRTEHDERGNVVRQSFFGVDARPCLHRDGYASYTGRHDARGNLVERVYFGRDGRPTLHRDGYARFVNGHDDRDRLIQVAYFDREGRPTLHRHGHSILRKQYDNANNVVEWIYLGLDGKPTLIDDGYSRSVSAHDANRRLVEKRHFDASDKPVNIADGYARFARTLDDKGNVVETAYFAADGSPARHRGGYSISRGGFNERGKQVSSSYFGSRGEPVISTHGYHRLVAQVDDRDNVTERAYVGTDGKPIPGPRGAKILRMQYDARGNMLRDTCWDDEGPVLDRLRGHRLEVRYDQRDRCIERRIYGIDGAPVITTQGYHGTHLRYDEAGNEVEVRYFGTDDKPILHWEGFARRERTFDHLGNRIRETWYGVDDKPTLMVEGVAAVSIEYDAFGNVVRESYFGLDGKPANRSGGGFAVLVKSYDERQRETGYKYFGPDGKPFRLNGLYHETRMRLNGQGKVIERTYVDVDGHPALNADGAFGYTEEFDARGLATARVYLNANGQRGAANDGHAETRYEHDLNGRLVQTSYLDAAGKPVRIRAGYAVVRREYDAEGKFVSRYLDAEGRPLTRRLVAANPVGSSVLVGDILISVQGKIPTTGEQLKSVLAPLAGKPAALKLQRKSDVVTVELPAQPATERSALVASFAERFILSTPKEKPSK